MTTLYVSNTASNGYAVGNDSNDGLPQDASSVGMTGTVTTEGSRPVGYDGEPFPDFDISVGAYQNRVTPVHPTQL